MKIERRANGAKVRLRENIRIPVDPAWTAALIERRRKGESLRALGHRFGVSHQTASNVAARWSDWYDRRTDPHADNIS
jgi:hypothetical protein